MGGGEEFHVSYFQERGRAEAEIEPDVRGWIGGFYAAFSSETVPRRPIRSPVPQCSGGAGLPASPPASERRLPRGRILPVERCVVDLRMCS